MRAHGYGAFETASPALQWGNIIWGYIVYNTPSINGILGYTIAAITLLFIATFAILYFGIESKVGHLSSLAILAAVLLVFMRPIMFPQFTINAGMLGIAGVFSLVAYSRQNKILILVAAFLLLYLGWIVRSNQLILILIISLPLLQLQVLMKDRKFCIAIFILVLFVIISEILNYHYYSSLEWGFFSTFQEARVYWMDYGGFSRLRNQPEFIKNYGLSINDVNLLSSWFFVDAKIADPEILNKMRMELGPIIKEPLSSSIVIEVFKPLISTSLAPVFILAFVLLLLFPSRNLLLSWFIACSALLYLGYLGRPGILRVYIPVFSLLVLAPLFINAFQNNYSIYRYVVAFFLIFTALVWNTSILSIQHSNYKRLSEQAQLDFNTVSVAKSFVVWGSALPYEIIYPVLGRSHILDSVKLYQLGTSTLNPFSNVQTAEVSGVGLVKKLLSEKGLLFNAGQDQMDMLELYCEQRHNKMFDSKLEFDTPTIKLYRARCLPPVQ